MTGNGGEVLEPDVFDDVDNQMIWDLHIRGGQPVTTVAKHLEMSVSKVYDRLKNMTVAAVPASEVRLHRDMEWARSEELVMHLWRDMRSEALNVEQRCKVASTLIRVMAYRAELKGLSVPRTIKVEVDTTQALHEEYAQLCESLGVERLDDSSVVDI